jgi:dTDP-4-amino-4,6-dideoxygalactose transaminase
MSVANLALYGGPPVRSEAFPEWPTADVRERELLLEVLDSRRWWSSQGTKVREFESQWAHVHGAETSIAVTNGSHTLEIALLALGVGEGDEVIVPNWTFVATIAAVLMVNAIPVIVDVELDTGCIDPEAVRAAVGPRTRAIIPVHIAGSIANMDALNEIAQQHDLVILEDCAHAHGSTWRGVPVGMLGDAGSYSFQSSKLMTGGEGGAIVSRHPEVLARARSFSDCGRQPGEWFYSHYLLGGNYRMTEWQGAVLLAQLERFPQQQQVRARNADMLNRELAQIPGIHPQSRHTSCTSQGNYCYVVRVDEQQFGMSRDVLREALIAEGISLTMAYPPLTRLDVFADPDGFAPRLRSRKGMQDFSNLQLPVSDLLADTTLWFTTSVLMGSENDARDVVRAMEKIHTHRDEITTHG